VDALYVSDQVELPVDEQRVVDQLRERIGTRLDSDDPDPYDPRVIPFVTEVNRDAIHHYAWGLDDLNPLWVDLKYANASSLGTIVAPPSMLFPLTPGGMSASRFSPFGEYGVHSTWGGAKMRWVTWIRAGTRVTTKSILKGVVVKRSKLSGHFVRLIGETKYFDANGGLFAESESWSHRKPTLEYGSAFSHVELKVWSKSELESVEREKSAESRRGAEPRYWEATSVGESLRLLKGPYSMNANLAFVAAWHPTHLFRGDIPWERMKKNPSAFAPGPQGLPEPPSLANHLETTTARTHGLPGAYDYGPQRCSWATQLFTDWMGDDGFLESLTFQVRAFNFVGDVQRYQGLVAAKKVEDGRHLVECTIASTNQRGEVTGVGEAVVRLPTTTAGAVARPKAAELTSPAWSIPSAAQR
jgi:acyl dehydratase